ncbi:MAG: hypothetical protein HY951_14645 [Bacteroidia bacterium]|nr:hypothetical protein [Bacteroidia bacterium]
MNTQSNKSELNDFTKPWDDLTPDEKKNILSVSSEKEYKLKQKVVSDYVNHFKDELMAFNENESMPETLSSHSKTSLKRIIYISSSLAAACLLIVTLYIFSIRDNNKHLSNNFKHNEIKSFVKQSKKDTIYSVHNNLPIININIKENISSVNKNQLSDDEIIQQIINNAIAETSNDEITEYLLNIGKEDIQDDDYNINISPVDTMNFEILLENL